ncbi:MAG TPA: spermidine synthase-like protein, partial [Syntrophus sp. (in: bacteria)]|nr:spermidine synthase-like protein [Syntrophus sp. (in: bacteria)]
MRRRVYPAIGLLSAATIAFQLSLMQILAITQWHHFAYMVISVALLGFGAAGTVLALFRNVLTAREDRGVPLLMLLAGAAMAAAVGLAQHPAVRFDAYLLFTGARPALRLLLTYAVFFVPFFLAGLAIGWTFSRHGRDIGVLYFWNLAGSGAGGLAGLGLMWVLPPAGLPAVLAGLSVLAGLLALPRKPGIALIVTALLSLLCVAAAIHCPPALVSSE